MIQRIGLMPGLNSGDALSGAILWIQSALLGSVATIVAVIAVAVFGLLMLNGSIDKVRGLRIVLGCALVFGAPAIAAALRGGMDLLPSNPPPAMAAEPAPPTPKPPAFSPAYDPYAGAAVPPQR